MSSSLIIPFISDSDDSYLYSSDTWAVIEQEEIPESAASATLSDTFSMLAMVRAGMSAREKLYSECEYLTVQDGVVTITIPFYVWVSSLDLAYTLESEVGEISRAVLAQKPRSFDVIFDNTDSVDVGFLFTGALVPEMPFFDSKGNKIEEDPEITVEGSTIKLSRTASCVLRATVIARGFSHDLIITLVGIETDAVSGAGEVVQVSGYDVDGIDTEVTVSWVYAGTEQSNVEELEIPTCVEETLNTCEDDQFPNLNVTKDTEGTYYVYYSTCSGEIISEFLQEDEE